MKQFKILIFSVLFIVSTLEVIAMNGSEKTTETTSTDDLDLSKMIVPTDTSFFFKDSNYYNWCNSILKDEQGVYHLFYSRWPKVNSFTSWLTHSTIAHATASSPQGPYTFQNTALNPRGTNFWDCYSTHNVRVIKENDTYYMFYSGSNSGKITFSQSHIDEIGHKGYAHKDWKTLRSSQRSGVAKSKSLNGPWIPLEKPVVEPSGPIGVVAVNPTVAKGPNDLYYMMLKGDDVRKSGIRLIQAIATAPNPEGPYSIYNKSAFDELRTEDAFMWYDNNRKRFYSVFHVHGGDFIGLITSENGLDWEKAKHYYVCKKEIKLNDGTVIAVDNMERPSIYFENDVHKILSFAIKKGDNAFIVMFNLK